MPGRSRVIVTAVILALGGFAGGCSDGSPGPGASDDSGARPAARPSFTFVNPLLTAEVGDYVLYSTSDAKTLRYEVQGVNPMNGRVTVLEERRDARLDRLLESQPHEFLPNDFLTGFGDFQVVKLSSETLFAGGRSWDCLAVDMESRMQGNIRAWFSSEVPVLGLVKRMRVGPGPHAGMVLQELQEWSGK